MGQWIGSRDLLWCQAPAVQEEHIHSPGLGQHLQHGAWGLGEFDAQAAAGTTSSAFPPVKHPSLSLHSGPAPPTARQTRTVNVSANVSVNVSVTEDMRPSTNGISKQHPGVCCGLQQQIASPPHPRKLSRIGLHTRCNLVTTWWATPRECVALVLAQLPRYYTRGLPCVLPASLLTGHISISDHGLRVQMDALAVNAAAAAVCSPRPTGDYRQAALGLVNRPEWQRPILRDPACSTQHTTHTAQHTSIRFLSQGCVEARALSNDQATSYCNATPPKQRTHIHI